MHPQGPNLCLHDLNWAPGGHPSSGRHSPRPPLPHTTQPATSDLGLQTWPSLHAPLGQSEGLPGLPILSFPGHFLAPPGNQAWGENQADSRGHGTRISLYMDPEKPVENLPFTYLRCCPLSPPVCFSAPLYNKMARSLQSASLLHLPLLSPEQPPHHTPAPSSSSPVF